MKNLKELEENIVAVFPKLKNMSKKERIQWNLSTKSSVEKRKRKILKKLVPKERRDKLGDSLANRYSILLNGDYGSEDFFFFNEFNIANQSGNLYDIDKKEFLYQEKAKMGKTSPKRRKYKYPMLSYWARIINSNGELCYVSLESLSSAVFYKLENKVSNYIDKLIPSAFVELPDNGQKTKSKKMGSLVLWSYHSCPKDLSQSYIKNCMDYFRMNLMIDLFYSLQNKLGKKDVLITKIKKKKGKEKDDKTSKDMTVIFSNVNQLKKVNTKTFLSDLTKLEKSDPSLIRKIAKKEFKLIKKEIDNKLKSLKHETVYKEILGVISKAIDSKQKPFSKKEYLRKLKALLSSNITEKDRNKAIRLLVTPLIHFISKKQLSREIETIASDICLSMSLPETKNKKYSTSLKKNRIDHVLSYAKKMKKSNDYKNSISLRMSVINASKFLTNGGL